MRVGKASRLRRSIIGLIGSVVVAVSVAGPVPVGAASASRAPQLSSACTTLKDAIGTITEPLSVAADQSPGWVPIQANGWTAFVPNNEWTLSASSSGADINSPNGQEDASLITWYQLGVPWTLRSLGQKFLGHLARVVYLCRTAVAQSPSGESQAMELTGYVGRQELRAVLIDSVLAQTTETSVGESRYLYTPESKWSAANAETLALVIRRAIQVPQSVG